MSPAIRLASVVERYERLWDVPYRWSERSLAVTDRLDFVARADEIAVREVATLLVVGALDDEGGFRRPAEQLRQALSRRAPARTALAQIPGWSTPSPTSPVSSPRRRPRAQPGWTPPSPPGSAVT